MTARDDILDQELQDTLDNERRRRGLPPVEPPRVAVTRVPRAGACVYCGRHAPKARVCGNCDDLPDLDNAA